MRRFASGLAVSIVLLGAGWVEAAITTVQVQPGDYVQMSFGSQCYQENGETGGEFGMTVWQSNPDGSQGALKGTFYTFCADPTTMMNIGTTYNVKTVANSNHLSKQLSDYGKWIYYEYALNDSGAKLASSIPGHQSADFSYTAAGAIQEGIWLNVTTSGANLFTGSIADSLAAGGNYPAGWDTSAYLAYAPSWEAAYIADTLTNSDGFETYKNQIGIAQLTLGSGNVQNQMVFTVVSGTPTTPEPATIIVWGVLGVLAAGFAVLRRRRRAG